MKHFLFSTALLALLSGCGDGQPFFDDTPLGADDSDDDSCTTDCDDDDDDDADGGDNAGDGDGATDLLNTGTTLPPDSESPFADGSLTRVEARNDVGGGLLASVIYVPGNDTFIVDGLGFDGANTYSRGTPIGQLSGPTAQHPDRPVFAVYEADVVTEDFLTGDQIGQIVPYRAIYGVSNVSDADGVPRTSFAIVRTGGYVGFGFGGFLYERNGGVELPTTGQAVYSGGYSGLRVFGPLGGMEYTVADMQVSIDFRDFNANDAVQGQIFNRVAYDMDGTVVPLGGEDGLVLPDLLFVIQEGAPTITENGEISGELNNSIADDSGALEIYESGTYYGILAGDMTSGDGGELVGVIVITSDDPRYAGAVQAQETGGFILYRGTGN
ncbi:MAG: hypothetical protein JKX69_15955 [Rhodobacteraceae bacterium]|nr:hypothetical protein [Paracoccaceae bacterium]